MPDKYPKKISWFSSLLESPFDFSKPFGPANPFFYCTGCHYFHPPFFDNKYLCSFVLLLNFDLPYSLDLDDAVCNERLVYYKDPKR